MNNVWEFQEKGGSYIYIDPDFVETIKKGSEGYSVSMVSGKMISLSLDGGSMLLRYWTDNVHRKLSGKSNKK